MGRKKHEDEFVPEGPDVEDALDGVKQETEIVEEFQLHAEHLQILTLVITEAMMKYPKVGMKWGHIRHISEKIDPDGSILEGMKFKLLFPRTFNLNSGETWTYWYASTTAIKGFEARQE